MLSRAGFPVPFCSHPVLRVLLAVLQPRTPPFLALPWDGPALPPRLPVRRELPAQGHGLPAFPPRCRLIRLYRLVQLVWAINSTSPTSGTHIRQSLAASSSVAPRVPPPPAAAPALATPTATVALAGGPQPSHPPSLPGGLWAGSGSQPGSRQCFVCCCTEPFFPAVLFLWRLQEHHPAPELLVPVSSVKHLLAGPAPRVSCTLPPALAVTAHKSCSSVQAVLGVSCSPHG